MKFIPIFYCKNVVDLFKFIAEGRGYHPQTEILELFGFDKGGKVCPSLKKVVNLKKLESEVSRPLKKNQASYEQGAFPKVFKGSGVMRTIILALAPAVPETYHNMSQIVQVLKFSYRELENPFDANDLLLSPKFVGVGTAKSTYPCHCCEMNYKEWQIKR